MKHNRNILIIIVICLFFSSFAFANPPVFLSTRQSPIRLLTINGITYTFYMGQFENKQGPDLFHNHMPYHAPSRDVFWTGNYSQNNSSYDSLNIADAYWHNNSSYSTWSQYSFNPYSLSTGNTNYTLFGSTINQFQNNNSSFDYGFLFPLTPR